MPKTSLSALVAKMPPSASTSDASHLEPAAPPGTPSKGTSSSRDPDSAGPRYLSLVRKDIRLRQDQLDALTLHARRLSRAKRGGERITENTLIRVAIDLLLNRTDDLAGVTEDELRAALR